MNQQLSGIIHGKTIELDNDPGLADGQMVVVTVLPKSADPKINPKTGRTWGEGFGRRLGLLRMIRTPKSIWKKFFACEKRMSGREIPE